MTQVKEFYQSYQSQISHNNYSSYTYMHARATPLSVSGSYHMLPKDQLAFEHTIQNSRIGLGLWLVLINLEYRQYQVQVILYRVYTCESKG
ncbi:Uncharacterised protein [Vibrio vulnificus]|nr:Uncharacterised protein [Vibrio vulnificus]